MWVRVAGAGKRQYLAVQYAGESSSGGKNDVAVCLAAAEWDSLDRFRRLDERTKLF